MTNPELKALMNKLRYRVTEHRTARIGMDISVHVNAIEIAVSLVDLILESNPLRPISLQEENWFKAGYQLAYVFDGSEWQDLADTYCQLVTEVERRNFFRSS